MHQSLEAARTLAPLHFLDLAGRLASRLARLARDADPEANEVRLDWPYTQSDLASMIGGTRQSVNKLLSGFVLAYACYDAASVLMSVSDPAPLIQIAVGCFICRACGNLTGTEVAVHPALTC